MITSYKRNAGLVSTENPVIIPQRRGETGYCEECDAKMYSKYSPGGKLIMVCYPGCVHTGETCQHVNPPTGRRHKVIITGPKVNLLKALRHMMRVRPARRGPGGKGGTGPHGNPGPQKPGGPKGAVMRPPKNAKEIVATGAFHDPQILFSRIAKRKQVKDYIISWQGQREFFSNLFAKATEETLICAIAVIPDQITIERITGCLYCWVGKTKKYLCVNASVANNIDSKTRKRIQTELQQMRDICTYETRSLAVYSDERDRRKPQEMLAIVGEWRVQKKNSDKIYLETVLYNYQQVAVIPQSPVSKWDHTR